MLAGVLPPDCLLVVDEAYIDFVWPPESYTPVQAYDKFENLVVLRTFSKAYGLAGLRVGYDDNRIRADLIKKFGKKLLSVNSEYSTSYAGPGGKVGANTLSMDSHVNAPFVAKCVKLILDDHTSGTS